MDIAPLIAGIDLVGVFVFAMSGAVAGQRHDADLFGALVLAFVTATAGGVIRDLVIGVHPPIAFANWHTLAVAVCAGLLVFFLPTLFHRIRHLELLLDAAGLGVFAATGAQAALSHGIDPAMAAVLGMLSGIGGGMVRDILVGASPIVLHAQVYAVAALAGAAVMVGGHVLGVGDNLTVPVGIAVCLVLRLTAIYRRWELPRAARRAGGAAS